MMITLKTPHKSMLDIFDIPIIGVIIFFIIALIPVPIYMMISEIYDVKYDADNGLIQGITAIWNLVLSYILKVKIGIFFIPCWILFFVVFCLKFFNIIN